MSVRGVGDLLCPCSQCEPTGLLCCFWLSMWGNWATQLIRERSHAFLACEVFFLKFYSVTFINSREREGVIKLPSTGLLPHLGVNTHNRQASLNLARAGSINQVSQVVCHIPNHWSHHHCLLPNPCPTTTTLECITGELKSKDELELEPRCSDTEFGYPD